MALASRVCARETGRNRRAAMITKRVGVVVPSLNVVVEDDLRRELPVDVGFHLARLRLKRSAGKVTQQDLLDAGADAVAQAGLLADARMDAIAFNCTGASISDGPAGALKLRDQIAEATGVKATTTILSVVRALKAVGITRMVHVCPFTAEFAIDEANFLKASGLEVVVSRGLNFQDAREAAKMTPEEIGEIAAKQERNFPVLRERPRGGSNRCGRAPSGQASDDQQRRCNVGPTGPDRPQGRAGDARQRDPELASPQRRSCC
jgi:maleate isomerase